MFVLLLAVALDLVSGEPPAPAHPVVWLGAAIDRLEAAAPDAERSLSLVYGAAAALGLPTLAGVCALMFERGIRRLPAPLRLLGLAAVLKPSFSVRMLLATTDGVRRALAAGDLASARSRLRALVSRDTAGLSPGECAAAAIESLAENMADSVIGPWLAYLLAGLPGAWAFRAVNTLDSRWGYHGRYELLGRVPARLDDLVAALPARLSAMLLIAGSRAGPGSPAGALRALCRDRTRTASPNAGWPMSAMAGALGRRLGKRGQYMLNPNGEACTAADLRRAQRIAVTALGVGLGAMIAGRWCAAGCGVGRRR